MEGIIGKLEELREYANDTVHPECDYNIYLALINMVDEITGDVEKALEKQIPMKPVYDHRYHELGCVYCGNLVSVWEETPNYCPQCGQAIDWSEEDE